METEKESTPFPAASGGGNGQGKYYIVRRTLGRIGRTISINPQKTDASLTAVMGIILRTLALILLVFAVLIIWRLLSNKDYVLEPFSVPQKMAEENGLTGTIIAARFHDALTTLKNEAGSVKADSLHVGSNEGTDLNMSVMGVDVSLNSIAYQVGKLLGREEKRLTGEIVRSGDVLSLNFRMSRFATVRFEEKIINEDLEMTTRNLLKKAAEEALKNTDPYRLAIILYRRKESAAAVELVRSIIRDRPHERTWAYHAWGNIVREQGNLEEACLKFNKAVELDSNFALSWVQWGYALLQMGKPAEAAEKLWRASKLPPINPDAMITLGWLHNNAREFALSDSAFAIAVKAAEPYKKTGVIYLSWAQAKFMQDSTERALHLSQLAASASSESAEGYVAKSTALLLQKDTSGAYRAALQGYELDPENISVLGMLVRAEYSVLKNYPLVVSRIQNFSFKPMHRDQEVMMHNIQSMAYNAMGKHDSAFAVIQRTIAINPKYSIPYTTLAETYAFQGNIEAFYSNLEKAFMLGFQPHYITLTEKPYTFFVGKPRFKALMEKYALKN